MSSECRGILQNQPSEMQGASRAALLKRHMSSTPIKILFLIDYFHRTGGTEQHLSQLIAGLPAGEFHSTLVAFDMGDNPLLQGLRERGVSVVHLPVAREYVPNALVQGWRLARLVRRNHYDVVQTYHQKADTFGALIVWLAGARYLVSSKRDTGDLRKPLHQFLNRHLQGLFEAFIMVSTRVREAVVTRDQLPVGRVITIYNGVDTNRFVPSTPEQKRVARERLGLNAEDRVVGMVAAFRREKNHDVFFDAVARARRAVPRLRVLAVGGGELLDQFKRLIGDSSLGDCTQFVGDVADVRPFLAAMDIGCLTPGANEGFSNAVLEQMAAGLPMIVTDIGGNAEAVVNGENGIVIGPNDPVALGDALVRMFSDPARRAEWGQASRRRAEQYFSLASMCSEHARLYRTLVRPGKPRAEALG
jgi:glycosyltransferase involved in cell wall biosynthesis